MNAKKVMAGPRIEIADYKDQRIRRYQQNELIRALAESVSDEELLLQLRRTPDFDADVRSWPTHDRIPELLQLANFSVPFECHLQLARMIDSMMREGYVGRRPLSPEHVGIYQKVHAVASSNESFRQAAETITPQLSTSLIGVSGMGKTTAVKRFLARTKAVIYHPQIDLYQVPYLHVEMPSDGMSVKALATGILARVDALLPGCQYYGDYVAGGRAGADTLMRSVARVMNKHCVGMLVCDEVQNLSNSRKGDQIVMTELVSLCNLLEVPILFIGTPKAERILGTDFRSARRALGFGTGDWNPLPRKEENCVPCDYVDFMEELWGYQLVRNPVALTEGMLDTFYACTQGIIDLAIKLFVGCQGRAMADGSEIITEQLVHSVYKKEMKLVHPMVEALARNDWAALAKFEDIKSLRLDAMVADMSRRHRGKLAPSAIVRPGHGDFMSRLAAAGEAAGLSAEDASAAAKLVSDDGTAKDMLDGMKQLADKVAAPTPVRRPKKGSTAPHPSELPGYEDRPSDYRRATTLAAQQRTTVVEQLVALCMAPMLDQLLCID